jgi:hypothetical protein
MNTNASSPAMGTQAAARGTSFELSPDQVQQVSGGMKPICPFPQPYPRPWPGPTFPGPDFPGPCFPDPWF